MCLHVGQRHDTTTAHTCVSLLTCWVSLIWTWGEAVRLLPFIARGLGTGSDVSDAEAFFDL